MAKEAEELQKKIHLLSSSEWFHIEAASSFKGSKRCLDVKRAKKYITEFILTSRTALYWVLIADHLIKHYYFSGEPRKYSLSPLNSGELEAHNTQNVHRKIQNF